MRVAAIYDIHGNLPALDAVLREIEEEAVDQIVVGGDVIPGPMPSQCVARLRTLDVPVSFIRGNGEREVLAEAAGTQTRTFPEPIQRVFRWVAEELPPVDQAFLATWPLTERIEVAGLGPVLFCHGTPGSDSEILTAQTPEDRLMSHFADLDVRWVVCGHTHMQFDREVGGVRVLNAGSVGMPFGATGAHWLLLGPKVEFRRTRYDLTAAAEAVRRTSYPQAGEFADREVLDPLSEAEALAMLRKGESK